MRRPLAVALAGSAILLLGGTLAGASPAGDAKVQTGDFTLSFNNDGGATAFCPPGRTATGGGFGTVDPPPLNVAINVSAPVNKTELPGRTRTGDRARAWYVFAYSGAGSEENMKVFVICSASKDARVRVASFSVPPSTTRSKVVSCPRGQRALGGGLGIATSPISGVYEEGSGPLSRSNSSVSGTSTGDAPRAWEVAAYNGFGVARSFQALVICSRARGRTSLPRVSLSLPTTASRSPRAPGGPARALRRGPRAGQADPELQLVESGPLSASGTTAGTVDGDVAVSWDGDVYRPEPARPAASRRWPSATERLTTVLGAEYDRAGRIAIGPRAQAS